MKNVYYSVIIALSTFLFVSCGTESTPIYKLTTSVNGEGTVTPSSREFDEGEKVTITSSPNDGWVFSRWEADWSSSQNPSTITMNSDKNIIGVFVRRDYPLNITTEGEGTVQERIISQSKSTDYPFETVVEVTPNSSDGWAFYNWGGDLSGYETPTQITVDGEKNITVIFKEGRFYTFTYSYDSNNNRIEEISYNSHGSVERRTTYSYDSNNNLIELISYNSGGSVGGRLTYSYDSNNNPIEWISYNSHGSVQSRRTYSYDSNNNHIELLIYRSDGSLIERQTYSYDYKNNRTEEIVYNSDGSINNRVTYSYDSNNNRIELIYYDSEGSVGGRRTYSYDSNNNRIEEISYNSHGSVERRTTYSYDSNNNLIEQMHYYSDGSVSARLTYSYDSNNNLIEQMHYNSDGSVSARLTYSYDSNNNLEGYKIIIFKQTQNKSISYEPSHSLDLLINNDCSEIYTSNHHNITNKPVLRDCIELI